MVTCANCDYNVTADCDYETEDHPATCTAGAYTTYACKDCGYAYDGEAGQPNGHTDGEPVKEYETAATCTTDGGYEIAVYCAVCSNELSRESFTVPAGHKAGEPMKEHEIPVTCTTDGSYEIAVCGGELSRETTTVAAPGHKWNNGVVTAATCISTGKKVYTCKICGDKKEETLAVDPDNHVGTEIRNKVEPTADADGYSGDTCCTGCGALLQQGKAVRYNDGYCPYCGGHHTGWLGAILTAIHGILWLFRKAFNLGAPLG